jgi:hypothetical protein
MSRTYKDVGKLPYSKIKIGKRVKEEAKTKKKTYSLEENRRALKLETADKWNWD